MKKIILILIVCNLSFASEGTKELKPGSAVTAFTIEDGFKLNEQAIKNLGISFNQLKGDGPWEIPKSALVRIKHSTGVYRKWDGWITLVFVHIVGQTKDSYLVRSIDLQSGDEIAVKGVSFLRMTEADLNSDTVDSCTH